MTTTTKIGQEKTKIGIIIINDYINIKKDKLFKSYCGWRGIPFCFCWCCLALIAGELLTEFMDKKLSVTLTNNFAEKLLKCRVKGNAGINTKNAANVSPKELMAQPSQCMLCVVLSVDISPNKQYRSSLKYWGSNQNIKGDNKTEVTPENNTVVIPDSINAAGNLTKVKYAMTCNICGSVIYSFNAPTTDNEWDFGIKILNLGKIREPKK